MQINKKKIKTKFSTYAFILRILSLLQMYDKLLADIFYMEVNKCLGLWYDDIIDLCHLIVL